MARLGAGITNDQARYLAALQRELGVHYTGNGMTRREASAAIKQALDELQRRETTPDTRPASENR